jgi:hypothetical protein
MAVLTGITSLTADGITPFITRFYIWTWRRPVFEFLGTTSLVLVIMKLGAGIPLTTQPWWLFAWFGLVIGQNVGRIQPLGIVIQ